MPGSASTSSHSCNAAEPAPVPGVISFLPDGALRDQYRRDALGEMFPRLPEAQREEAALRSNCWATAAEAGLVAEREERRNSRAAPKGALANNKSAPTRDYSTPSGSGQGTGKLAGSPGGGSGPELNPPSGDGGGAGDTVPRGLKEPPTAPFCVFCGRFQGRHGQRTEEEQRAVLEVTDWLVGSLNPTPLRSTMEQYAGNFVDAGFDSVEAILLVCPQENLREVAKMRFGHYMMFEKARTLAGEEALKAALLEDSKEDSREKRQGSWQAMKRMRLEGDDTAAGLKKGRERAREEV